VFARALRFVARCPQDSRQVVHLVHRRRVHVTNGKSYESHATQSTGCPIPHVLAVVWLGLVLPKRGLVQRFTLSLRRDSAGCIGPPQFGEQIFPVSKGAVRRLDISKSISSAQLELLNQYPTDNVAQSNLGGCYLGLRNIPKALEAARRAVEIAPKGVRRISGLVRTTQ